jgi:K+/H+ antiporter YhaU regulatory subunit KhtT
VQDRTGALVIAVRSSAGVLLPNPSLDTTVEAGWVLIAAGTQPQLQALQQVAGAPR